MEAPAPNPQARPHVFNYQLQRLMIGITAGLLPVLVSIFGCSDLPSISASYHTGARNIFVACLSAVGALMIPYQGKDSTAKSEFYLAKVGGVMAIVVAFVPTACPTTHEPSYQCFTGFACTSANSPIHLSAAAVVFGSLGWLCVIFRRRALNKKSEAGPKAVLRAHIYVACLFGNVLGVAIIALNGLGVGLWATAVYWGETMMLLAFSVAWITASQTFLLIDGERPTVLPPR